MSARTWAREVRVQRRSVSVPRYEAMVGASMYSMTRDRKRGSLAAS